MRDLKLVFKFKLMEEKRVKKFGLVLALTLVLVCAFTAVALAQTSGPIPQLTPTLDRQHAATDVTKNAHGGFTINGDTCSACHSMHYAGNGFNLTLVQGTYASEASGSAPCLACHDGTTGNYNVIAGKNGANDLAMGGLFATYDANGRTEDAVSGSQHDAFGTVEAYTAAPGGRGSAPTTTTYDYGTWKAGSLTCGSCHEAHIAINPRLLSVNPNGIMDDKVVTDENAVDAAGVDLAYVNNTTNYYFKKAPAAVDPENELGITVKVGGVELEYIKDYQIKWETVDSDPNLVNDANKSLDVTKDASGNIIRAAKPGFKSVFKKDRAYVVINKAGLVANAAVQFTYKPAFQVQMKISSYNQVGEYVQYGLGVEKFCTACHTDFFGSKTKKVTDPNNPTGPKIDATNTGIFGGLAHHTGDRPNEGIAVLGNYTPDSISGGDLAKESIGSCLTCHFAHGTDQARWAAVSTNAGYVDGAGNAIYNVAETQAGSAANKRLPNNAMCVLCHDMVSGAGSGNSAK